MNFGCVIIIVYSFIWLFCIILDNESISVVFFFNIPFCFHTTFFQSYFFNFCCPQVNSQLLLAYGLQKGNCQRNMQIMVKTNLTQFIFCLSICTVKNLQETHLQLVEVQAQQTGHQQMGQQQGQETYHLGILVHGYQTLSRETHPRSFILMLFTLHWHFPWLCFSHSLWFIHSWVMSMTKFHM